MQHVTFTSHVVTSRGHLFGGDADGNHFNCMIGSDGTFSLRFIHNIGDPVFMGLTEKASRRMTEKVKIAVQNHLKTCQQAHE